MAVDRNTLTDGYLTLEQGVDSGFAPSLIQPNQLSWAVNTTVRSGWPEARPGIRKKTLDFSAEYDLATKFQDGLFQGRGTYLANDGQSYLAVSVSGRIFTINVSTGFKVKDITISSDPNMAMAPKAWFQQAGRNLIVQNGSNLPFIYNGSSSRRANSNASGKPREVPIGGPMAFGKGRLWVAQGSKYFGGDLINGNPALGTDSVLGFTENTYLNEGGSFWVSGGPITGLSFAANTDSANGVGDLLVFTPSNIFAFDAPVDRTVWKNLDYPIQRYGLLNFGALSQESIVSMNGDLVFRAQDGVRSYIIARRDFSQWGNTPISRQITRALKYDTTERLYQTSAVNFDNRMLMTVGPQHVNNRGIYHEGLVVMDYHLVSGMGRKLDPVWEGVWTGLRILSVVTVQVDNVDRCYIFALSEDDKIELWELTKDAAFDFDGSTDVATEWTYETKSFTFNTPNNKKDLIGMDQWYDKLMGQMDMTLYYRADLESCWNKWGTWSDCAIYKDCLDAEYPSCQTPLNYQGVVRNELSFPQPPIQVDAQTTGFKSQGFEFQFRAELKGRLRMKRNIFRSTLMGDDDYGQFKDNFTCYTPAEEHCQTGCTLVTCCELPDYGYKI